MTLFRRVDTCSQWKGSHGDVPRGCNPEMAAMQVSQVQEVEAANRTTRREHETIARETQTIERKRTKRQRAGRKIYKTQRERAQTNRPPLILHV